MIILTTAAPGSTLSVRCKLSWLLTTLSLRLQSISTRILEWD